MKKLLSLLKYVSGDYKDRATFAAIKQALGKARSGPRIISRFRLRCLRL